MRRHSKIETQEGDNIGSGASTTIMVEKPASMTSKGRRKTAAEKQQTKPKIEADTIAEEDRMDEVGLRDLMTQSKGYSRHVAAPYAFNYRGIPKGKYAYLDRKSNPQNFGFLKYDWPIERSKYKGSDV